MSGPPRGATRIAFAVVQFGWRRAKDSLSREVVRMRLHGQYRVIGTLMAVVEE